MKICKSCGKSFKCDSNDCSAKNEEENNCYCEECYQKRYGFIDVSCFKKPVWRIA